MPVAPPRPRPFITPLRTGEVVGLALILLFAAALRLGWPGMQEFKRDEAALLALSLDLVEGRSFPLHGIGSSVGVPNSPMSVYLFALSLLAPWNRDPMQAGMFPGVLGVMAVFLCWLLTRRYWGERAALLSALLFAASPWAAVYSRKVWAQDLLPLFTLAWAATGMLALAEGRRRWIAPHLALLAILAQTHLSAVALAPVTLIALILYRGRVALKWLIAGTAAAVATAIPVGLHWLTGGAGDIGQAAAVATRPVEWSLHSIEYAWMVSTGSELHSLAGPLAFRELLDSVPSLGWVPWGAGVALLLGAAVWLWGLRHSVGAPDVLLGLWLVAPVAFFLRHSTPVYPHYFILLYPAPFILGGSGLACLLDRISIPHARLALSAGLITLALAQAWSLVRLGTFLSSTATPGGFGTPLGMLNDVATTARLLSAGTDEIVVVGEGDAPDQHETPAVMSVLLRGLPVRYVDGDEAAVWPSRPALVVLWPGTTAAERNYEGWGGLADKVTLRSGEGEVTLRRFAGPGTEMLNPIFSPRLLANRAELLGYEWSGGFTPGSTSLWRLEWRAPAPDGAYHFFNHLLSADGSTITGVDGEGLAPASWREGDHVVSYFAFTLPQSIHSAPYFVRVGMYEYPSLTAVPVLDAAANPYADFLVLGPLGE